MANLAKGLVVLEKTVNIHTAKTNLSRLLVEVEGGEEIVIARAGKPVARLVPFKPRKRKRVESAPISTIRFPRGSSRLIVASAIEAASGLAPAGMVAGGFSAPR